ncbi:hypothetical protein J6590_030283 [Homalodisca vitripennis]|nr:hypothetical protein J6590_030283 [Homalodisca vitripennis]
MRVIMSCKAHITYLTNPSKLLEAGSDVAEQGQASPIARLSDFWLKICLVSEGENWATSQVTTNLRQT